ncbi:hypothetical protein B0I35DRAFT_479372 [Stachybotrys elegans]|uniref:EGF-like domain-containing protein n=1 Tax=Stachybotrys elegans TaxID=80388 RepID=A0A8K0ST56_9HYPO|nr:hypothetical protein B0I35DRAFT_479372 [Stachybotrys elegans]
MTQDTPRAGYNAAPSRTVPQQSRLPRPQAPAGFSADGNYGESISRPRPVPQWPLGGPMQSPMNAPNPQPYRPPQGQAPRRPPRPSLVPSILDQSRVQDPSPVFLSPQMAMDPSMDRGSIYLSTPVSPASARLTVSSVGSIPDFPMPITNSLSGPPRRGSVLGPPPSSRRGASSFYSTASFVSPIPEESPKSRSHGSYASSAAIPNQWEAASIPGSPISQGGYEDSITDKSRDSEYEFGDESNLVRSASIGKAGKPSLIITRNPNGSSTILRPAPSPVQPFGDGTAYLDPSTSSSNTLPTTKMRQQPAVAVPGDATPESILEAYAAATASSPSASPRPSPRPTPSPRPPQDMADLRRPPRLDIEAVREAEARGSLTSLPDLIRRATRLAAMIDTGKRPASRFDDLRDYLGGRASGGYPLEKDTSNDERYRSGLSDMLAAFPPPAQATRQPRGSWFRTTSWPLAPGRRSMQQPPSSPPDVSRNLPSNGSSQNKKAGRRCCGMPMWAFIMLVILLVLIIATAVIIPLQFFVFGTLGSQAVADNSLEDCRADLNCQNGGTNVLSQGVCSCICTNGFSGSDCTIPSDAGCTTTDIVGPDGSSSGSIENVTLGRAIPRIIADASSNFSIPLSGTAILARFNNANLSCIAQNSLVTFNGQSSRSSETDLFVPDSGEADIGASRAAFITLSDTNPRADYIYYYGKYSVRNNNLCGRDVVNYDAADHVFYTDYDHDHLISPSGHHLAAEWARQNRRGDTVTLREAASIDLGNNNIMNLVNFTIDIGQGPIGGNAS